MMNVPRSGIKGITYNRNKDKWQLYIGKRYFGLFDTVEAADEARRFYESVLAGKGDTPIRQMTTKEMRKLLGMTQAEFCSKYDISRRTLCNWEYGISSPPEHTLKLLQRAVLDDLRYRPGDFKL